MLHKLLLGMSKSCRQTEIGKSNHYVHIELETAMGETEYLAAYSKAKEEMKKISNQFDFSFFLVSTKVVLCPSVALQSQVLPL